MKVKASPRARKVVVELDPDESDLPVMPAPEIAIRKILVPVDFSQLSRKALHYATSFSKQFGSEIILLHVVEIITSTEVVESGMFHAQLRETATAQLAAWRKDVPGQTTVRTALGDGTPYREIVRAADENNVDLIILGTQGRSGVSRFFIGSTAERVVRHAPCPVMVVRERERDFLNEERISTDRKNLRK